MRRFPAGCWQAYCMACRPAGPMTLSGVLRVILTVAARLRYFRASRCSRRTDTGPARRVATAVDLAHSAGGSEDAGWPVIVFLKRRLN